MNLFDATEYKDLSIEEFEVFIEAVGYALVDYSYYLEETEPYATNTIQRFRDAGNHFSGAGGDANFLEWLQKQ